MTPFFTPLKLSLWIMLALLGTHAIFAVEAPAALKSPDGKLAVQFNLAADGAPRYSVQLDGKPVLRDSKLGLVRDDADFSAGLKLAGASPVEAVRDEYEILTAKRRLNVYQANRQVFHLETAAGKKMDVVFQVSNDGVAFRYVFPETSAEVRKLSGEATSFHFFPETRAWLQPMSVAKTGWQRTNPSYEEYYQKDIAAGTPSPLGAGWVYPALFRSGDTWLLVSETGLGRNYCGTRLGSESPDSEYAVAFPDPREGLPDGAVNPESTLPWATPWRIIVIGSLKTVTESMLGVDLADKPAVAFDPANAPGKASWSWPLLGDRQTNYNTQRRFIDYAADMGWRYCLIDGYWDRQIGYERVKELIDYAKTKGVSILLWYNSAGSWNGAPQTPRGLMLTRESRDREFARLKEMGVAGLKVDFFGGDGQSMINYYHDLMSEAAAHGLTMNFHGATLPRGWQRTYPNLMTMESIKGLEFMTFEQVNANEEAAHSTVIPFTRNVFDPMDFTPVALDRLNARVQRRTTSAFELALAVLFTSGIQHYAEIPEGMAKTPAYVKEFMKRVPAVWEDVKFIEGEPGKYVVLARRGGGRWYVAGINGEDTERKLALDFSPLAASGANFKAALIADGPEGNLSFREAKVDLAPGAKFEITLPARGGFVMTAE